jgi:hypothetical protein
MNKSLFKKIKLCRVFDFLPHCFNFWYYSKIHPILNPYHSRIRKSIPNESIDISDLILNVNFEMIKSFYEEDYSKTNIDWNRDRKQKTFSNWLKKTYSYITDERVRLQKKINDASSKHNNSNDFLNQIRNEDAESFNFISSEKSYKKIYGEVDKLEKILHKKDDKVLTDMIKYRDFFWI